MRLSCIILSAVLCGIVLGCLATWLSIWRFGPSRVVNGPWRISTAIGSAETDAWLRADISLHRLFALSPEEAAYFTATTDDDGQTLTGTCRYRIEGRDPDARWWSITAYGPDDFFVPDPARRYSALNTTVIRDPDGRFSIPLGLGANGANTIATGTGRFSLTLRLYNPGAMVLIHPALATLPRLIREFCP